jgi:DNA repair exonuclease SbcCD ATPase subunit
MADLLDLADSLYALPLEEFTAARDALAKQFKSGQDADPALASRVQGLRKASRAAWVLNLLVRREADQVAEILGVAEALREAQSTMDGEQLRALTRQRRQLTAAVAARARSLAAESGVPVSGAVSDQVEATLTAALLDADAARALSSGLLVQPLAALGFAESEAVAAVALPEALGFTPAAASDPGPRLRVVADPARPERSAAERRESLERDVAAAQTRLDAVRAEEQATRSRLEVLHAQVLQHQAEADEFRRRVVALEAAQERLDDDITDLEEELSLAEASTRQAESERQAAVAALAALRAGR